MLHAARLVLCALAVLAPSSAPRLPVTTGLAGSTITSVTSGGTTVAGAGLVTGTSNANATLFGSGADADDLDLATYFAKNGNSSNWDVDLTAWVDTNGVDADFFIFEAGGNDVVTVAAWFPDGTFGQPVPVSGWTGTGYVLTSGPNNNQQVFGVAVAAAQLEDAAGQALAPATLLRGLRIISDTIDGCAFAAIDPAGAVNLPPTANAGPDRVTLLPATTATLDGTGSSDAEDPVAALSFSWSQVSGPAPAVLGGATTDTLVASGLVLGTYGFELTVTDTAGATATDQASVFVLPAGAAATISGELRKWHRITLTFPTGPASSETGSPNPFLDFRLDVTFSHGATGKTRVVPGFFAADGRADQTHATGGSTWRAHFLPDEPGTWTWSASFVTGAAVAVAPSPAAGAGLPPIDGAAGSFTVLPTNKSAPDFRARGLLRYQGQHHLVFAETGERFLKGGADSPENFLGYYGFDGTYDTGGLATPGLVGGLHRFAPHAVDWRLGDPNWIDEDGDSGRNIIGALDYLASQGGNSVYFLTYNVDGGDGRDTWPWISTPPNPPTVADQLRFDCSKLAQWEILFSHMDRLGIQLHVVTQETENDNVLDGGGLGTIRRLYYRELVARFAHHHAVIWNLGEENSNSDAERLAFAQAIRALDPYDHPITVHTNFNAIAPTTGLGAPYTALYGNPDFEATSLQGTGTDYNAWAISIRDQSALAGRPWAVYGDEQGPRVDAHLLNLDLLRVGALWGNLAGGGAGVEWYFGYQGTFGDVQSEDWTVVKPLWEQTAHALAFFHRHTRFWEMAGRNDLVGAFEYALAKPGERYAVYTLSASQTALALDLETSTDTFAVGWVDPRSGTGLGAPLQGSVSTITGPGVQSLGLPPSEVALDWVAVVENVNLHYYGTGAVSSRDLVPAITSVGSPTIPNPAWSIRVADLPPAEVTYLLIGLLPASIPLGPGALLVQPVALAPPFLVLAVASPDGDAVYPLPVPAVPAVAGIELYLQAIVLDGATEGGVGLSEGLRVRLHL